MKSWLSAALWCIIVRCCVFPFRILPLTTTCKNHFRKSTSCTSHGHQRLHANSCLQGAMERMDSTPSQQKLLHINSSLQDTETCQDLPKAQIRVYSSTCLNTFTLRSFVTENLNTGFAGFATFIAARIASDGSYVPKDDMAMAVK